MQEIAAISKDVPEQFRDKCFELLLASLIDEKKTAKGAKPEDDGRKEPEHANESGTPKENAKITLKTQLRLLVRRTGVALEDIEKILLYENGEVHFVKEPHDVAVAQGQIEWALLLALQNAILKDSLVTDAEDVRSVCQEKGFYDTKNFASNFKKEKAASYFRNALVPQGEAQSLTGEGQDALGRLIKRLAGTAA